jgi:very-short-patch-repair endonuclease
MNVTKNLAWIHRDRRERYNDYDIDEKFRMIYLLKKYFKLTAVTDEVLFFDRTTHKRVFVDQSKYESKQELVRHYHVHYPDLVVKNHKPVIAVEIDGPVHWQNTKALKRTNERNLHYEDGGIKILWLTKDDVLVKDQSDLILNVAGKLGINPRVTYDSD